MKPIHLCEDIQKLHQKIEGFTKKRIIPQERLMELEDTVKWTEMQRAKKAAAAGAPSKKNNGGIWDL